MLDENQGGGGDSGGSGGGSGQQAPSPPPPTGASESLPAIETQVLERSAPSGNLQKRVEHQQ